MEKQNVEYLFDNISAKYDIANYFTSLGIERIWRKKFSSHITGDEKCILDACCGTGFSTFNIINKIRVKNSTIFGIDFSEEMLAVARCRLEKISAKIKNRINSDVEFIQGDVTNLNFEDNCFDLITIVFGIRNVVDREKALKEFLRVAKQGGKLVIMEFNFPENSLFRKLYTFYMNRILVNIGGIITKNKKAYEYLIETIRNFPSVDSFSNLIRSAGWADVIAEKLTFETCTIFSAVKK
ncbi:bifunctional demethylmenaquinone methyltransferase/2-methoxy-6-polyprenyl-1,4-benzoquinol methylase UbiE [bacterium]|nr:bifunctional demethylmenaquinone methyltransferase/2-methoxy-6-polyprenyl-1,4-benzoquinol methylase UbiE [bacterium]